MEISKSELRSGNTLAIMKFSWCADRESFVKAFDAIGLPIKSEQDLETLYEWSKSGADKSGKIKNTQGRFITLDINQLVSHGIKLRHDKVLQCRDIKFVK